MSKQAREWLDLNHPPLLDTSDTTPLQQAMASSQDPSLHQCLNISDPNWRNWADGLPPDIMALIAGRLLDTDEKDLVHFQAVCSPWRASLCNENIINRHIHPRRWILLPEPSDATLCKFVNIATGQLIQLQNLHQLIGHTVAKGPHANPEGVLVLRDESTLVIRIFNPLTRQLVDLPSLKTLIVEDNQLSDKEFEELYEVTAVGFAGDSKVVLYFGANTMLVVAKPGDEDWEVVITYDHQIMSVATIEDRFYCLSTESLLELDTTTSPPELVVVSQIVPLGDIVLDTQRLVDNGGELLVLWNELCPHPQGFWYPWYTVNQIDFHEGLIVPNCYLYDRAVFVGPGGAISVSTKDFPELDANTIYFPCCNKGFVKQCALSNTYECYQPPPGSFAECLTSYVTNSRVTNFPH